jgi:hypothetical protein
MPVVTPSQTAAAPGAAADATTGTEGDIDFAAVLKAQIAQPAKDAPGTEIIAALMPSQTVEAAEGRLRQKPAGRCRSCRPCWPAWCRLRRRKILPIRGNRPTCLPASSQLPLPRQTIPVAANPAAPARLPRWPCRPGRHPLQLAAGTRDDRSCRAACAARRLATTIAADPQMPAAAAEHANPSAACCCVGTAAAPLAHATPAGDAPSIVRVDTPVGNRGWDAEIGQKVVLLVNRQESRAELTLTPPHLGKVEVSISVNGDQTSATFISANPAAREALEQALPRLREILAEAGITLGQASVNAESAPRDRDGSPRKPAAATGRRCRELPPPPRSGCGEATDRSTPSPGMTTCLYFDA